MLSKKYIIATLGIAGALCAGVAQAHDDVQWSVTIGAPAYPVYRQPAPVYAPVPVYTQPVPVYQDHRYHHSTRWDVDGDGIPNRYDRVYNPRWDRNGNGVADRYEYRNDRYRGGWGR